MYRNVLQKVNNVEHIATLPEQKRRKTREGANLEDLYLIGYDCSFVSANLVHISSFHPMTVTNNAAGKN